MQCVGLACARSAHEMRSENVEPAGVLDRLPWPPLRLALCRRVQRVAFLSVADLRPLKMNYCGVREIGFLQAITHFWVMGMCLNCIQHPSEIRTKCYVARRDPSRVTMMGFCRWQTRSFCLLCQLCCSAFRCPTCRATPSSRTSRRGRRSSLGTRLTLVGNLVHARTRTHSAK